MQMSSTEAPSQLDDRFADLLSQARHGDSRAMGQLLELPRAHLLAIARRQIPRQHHPWMAPSDAVQVTLTSANSHFEQFRGASGIEFFEWLRTILVNTVRDFLRVAEGRRKQRPHRTVTLEGLAEEASLARHLDDSRSVCDRLIDQEVRASIRRCIEVLPEHYRRVLHLRYDEAHRFAEIAAEMGTTFHAVIKLRRRAIEALRELLRAYGIVDEEVC
jgi:RNA polymerase sigma-70 factor (ECF subfamily)